jgi:predicted small secreted protein
MKRWLWIGSLALGASLLVACNQSGGSNEEVGSTQRVIVRQLDTQSARVLYRLENASHWPP